MAMNEDDRDVDLEKESAFYEDPMYDEDTYFAERLDRTTEEDVDMDELSEEEAGPAPSKQPEHFGETIESDKPESANKESHEYREDDEMLDPDDELS